MYKHCCRTAPAKYGSFTNNRSFLQKVDSLPGPKASWKLIEITVTGNQKDADGQFMKERLDCWARSPVEVIGDLLGNPEFKNDITFAPYIQELEELQRQLENATDAEKERIFEEMASAEWWRKIQEALSAQVPHATVAPVILATDKTQLSTFSGDKQAWPVYLTIGNINKDVRRQPSRRAVSLLGYLPVSKLLCFRESDRSVEGYRLFHFAMSQILAPLVEAGKSGVEMNCADGSVRLVFPLLAAYIADHPEQCLICCNKENRCPTCLVDRDRRGELLETCYLRDPLKTLAALQDPSSDAFSAQGLRDIPTPFWAELPYANIFNCIAPDLLHQLHKGVFMNHLVKWVSHGREQELDARFMRAVPPYPNLRIFQKGISTISQWTGNEFRQMEKVFIALIDGLHEDPRVMVFPDVAHYPSHTTSTLEQMAAALETFHANKDVFIEMGIRQHFNIPKVHWLNHYIASIIDFGSCDGLSTEISERLHIDFAKMAYRASNRKEYIRQMVVWFSRREKSEVADEDGHFDVEVGAQSLVFGPYRISRYPGLGTLSAAAISATCHAPGFTAALRLFLQEDGIPASHLRQDQFSTLSFPVYKKFTRVLPSLRGVKSEIFRDTVFSTPAAHGKPARHSCILYLEDEQIAETIGYRVAQVRALFALPPSIQRLRPDATDLHSHLAYVELYTRLYAAPDAHSKLYPVARVYERMARKGLVIPVNRIFRSCHLIPNIGREVSHAWTSDNVIEECDLMYLNSFSDHHMFLFV
ncbi:hypothetical protein BN946_scf184846.g5 [Trametes cinnabarina]|uniref:Uncharacterized protein n=1 Tax=Pycnoporus cinnabarinus TaxID=5643 RepID=A0A060SQL7_PYCCI|nr:hypothetical protein BN946_scf184846.g5 [Trametes cinnabarina]